MGVEAHFNFLPYKKKRRKERRCRNQVNSFKPPQPQHLGQSLQPSVSKLVFTAQALILFRIRRSTLRLLQEGENSVEAGAYAQYCFIRLCYACVNQEDQLRRCFEIFLVVDLFEAYAYNCHVVRGKYFLLLRLARADTITARVHMLKPICLVAYPCVLT